MTILHKNCDHKDKFSSQHKVFKAKNNLAPNYSCIYFFKSTDIINRMNEFDNLSLPATPESLGKKMQMLNPETGLLITSFHKLACHVMGSRKISVLKLNFTSILTCKVG